DKLLALYQRNLEKKGLPPPPARAAAGAPAAHGHASLSDSRHAHAAEPRAHAPHGPRTSNPHHDPAAPHPAGTASRHPAAAAPARAEAAVDGSTDPHASRLEEARRLRASDLHLMSGAAPVVRIASVLHDLEMPPVSAQTVEHALQSILQPEQWQAFLTHKDM